MHAKEPFEHVTTNQHFPTMHMQQTVSQIPEIVGAMGMNSGIQVCEPGLYVSSLVYIVHLLTVASPTPLHVGLTKLETFAGREKKTTSNQLWPWTSGVKNGLDALSFPVFFKRLFLHKKNFRKLSVLCL